MSKVYQETATEDKGKQIGADDDAYDAALNAMENFYEGMKVARNLVRSETEQVKKLLNRARGGEKEVLTSPHWMTYHSEDFMEMAIKDKEEFEEAVRSLLRSEDRKLVQGILASAPTRQMIATYLAKNKAMRRHGPRERPPTDGADLFLGDFGELKDVWETPLLWIERWVDRRSIVFRWLVCRKDTCESALTVKKINWKDRKIEDEPVLSTLHMEDVLDAVARVHGFSIERVYSKPCFDHVPLIEPMDQKKLTDIPRRKKPRGNTAKRSPRPQNK
jgi:hypothetical protein